MAMRRRRAALLLAAGLSASCAPPTPPEPPDVLLVTLDTTRADFISHLGGPAGVTPAIDALAARSVTFTRAHSETNITNPSHLSMMTGLRAIEHGVYNNLTRIPYDLDTLPQAFRRAGYATAGFVSTRHLGREFGWTGFSAMPDAHGPVRADEVTDRALGWVQQVDDRPVFLWAHYYDPHAPYDPPPEIGKRWSPDDPGVGSPPPGRASATPAAASAWRRKKWRLKSEDPGWARAMYTAEIAFADREVGRLIRTLEAMRGEFVLIVTADHGESLGEHGIEYSHAGLFEPSLHVPLLVRAPGFDALRSNARVSTLDVAPTLAELAGIELAHPTTGRSLVPLLAREGNGADPAEIVIYQGAHNRGVAARRGPWKLIWPIMPKPPLPETPQLFDLSSDPEELANLSRRHPERVAELREALDPWIEMGLIRPKESEHLDPSALEQLRSLGYVEP